MIFALHHAGGMDNCSLIIINGRHLDAMLWDISACTQTTNISVAEVDYVPFLLMMHLSCKLFISMIAYNSWVCSAVLYWFRCCDISSLEFYNLLYIIELYHTCGLQVK